MEKNKGWVMKNKTKQTKKLITSNMSNKKNKAQNTRSYLDSVVEYKNVDGYTWNMSM